MTNGINTRALILEVLLEINQEEEYSHIAIGNVLTKHQFLPKQERAFIARVCEGTVEQRIYLDYVIEQFSKVPVKSMKPAIREIMRSAVYQLVFMDSVPDSAACNEAVKLVQKKGFYNLKAFVNGVLRNVARGLDSVQLPDRADTTAFLSVRYSMPEWIVERWLSTYGAEVTESILRSMLLEKNTTFRCTQYQNSTEETLANLRSQGAVVEQAPYLANAYYLKNFSHLMSLRAFINGKIQIQDISSMLVGEIADPKRGDYVLDLCAAPGGKALHLADKMLGFGTVDARDISEKKVELIRENMVRVGAINVFLQCKDAKEEDTESIEKADIVLADVPCSGLGVIGKKPDIKYKVTPEKISELVILQRQILTQAVKYAKPGGRIIFSTCTISREENENNLVWMLKHLPVRLENMEPSLPEELHTKTTQKGYLQLLPGIHKTDGFFIANLVRK
ncbi:MAG: 16S rRNA (cytosine(967)-C(5))-methyltransferase RsmB [Lachnospiraceae bacterium]